MSLLINAGYGLKFNGISDSVLVPTNNASLHGKPSEERKRLPATMNSFTLETWFIPDSGGTIFEQDNMMRLSVGSPSSPAPASFEVRLQNKNTGRDSVYTLTSAKPVNKANGTLAYWDGILFPSVNSVITGSNLGSSVDSNDVSAFTDGTRELLNVTVTFDRKILSMHVNGDLLVEQVLEEEHQLVPQQSQMFLGGRGGDFRGTLETIHLSAGALPSGRSDFAPIKSDSTLGLWRFEEPINPIATRVATPALTASTSQSTISIGTTAAAVLIEELTGQTGKTFVSFIGGDYSQGNYTVKKYAATSTSDISIPKVPYNLLINPLGYNTKTGKPTNKAPERVRLLTINSSTGDIIVESIHLDFAAASNGRRGLLMAHDAGEFVVITGDCLVDGGNGNVFQPQGSGTQFSQRQGQVIIDESDFENHGLMFSMSMAIDSHEYNQFSASTTNMGEEFLIGHSGRHILNHVTSHPFMGALPPTESHIVEKKLDAGSDVVTATFIPQFGNIKDIIPVNSVVSSFDEHGPVALSNVVSSSRVSTFVENGMADIDESQRGLLALGGPQFDTEPFLLKSISSTDSNTNIKAVIPSIESRIATLILPELETYDYAPFVQIHYNAIDRTGEHFNIGATSRLTTNISTATLTLQSIKSFGTDSAVIPAQKITIDGHKPFSSATNQTAKISHSAKTIVFSATPNNSSFNTAAVNNAIVKLADGSPKLLVSKTLPDVSTIVTGTTRIIDLMRDSMAIRPLALVAPGGLVTFDTPDLFPFEDGHLEGEDSEGIVGEDQLNLSLCPTNYLPQSSSDTPQTTPQAISVAQSELASRSSVFHKILVKTNLVRTDDFSEVAGVKFRKASNGSRGRIGLKINNSGGYSASTTAAMSVDGGTANQLIAVDDNIYKANGKLLGIVTAVTTNSVTIGAGIADAVVDDDELFIEPQSAGRGSTNQSTIVHEYFDIIEHKSRKNVTSLVVQPCNRSRFAQLSKVVTDKGIGNHITIEHLSSKGRVLSFGNDNDGNTVLRAHGLLSDIASSTVSVKGSASPDSHIVKEIMPGAPVVAITLGGAGQGAINTKETWDPSPLARLAWNTRRDCQTAVSATSSTTVTVLPLNNKATDLQSWGTYCFPKTGRIYLEIAGNQGEQIQFASAEYASKTGDVFTFASGSQLGTGKFLQADGSESDTFANWITATGIVKGSVLHVDDKFSEESMCNDGTTINDRLFQSLDTVQHDYQLGTQYASTRALVEIPLFEEFFFDNPDKGIFPGPDNSMKLHVDATHTAHSWSPNPVGRRPDSISPQDPEIFGPFSYSIQNKLHRSGTKVTQPYTTSDHKIYVEDANIFPIPTAPATDVAGISGGARYRRAFLPNGEWVIYDARNTTSHYLEVAGAHGDDFIASENFFRDLKVGAHLTPAPGYQDMNYNSIADNPSLISAGYENRRSFYYDRSNVMTQGGNTDYGLKQYVSAIELKAGPSTNPHLPKVVSKRPRANLTTNLGVPVSVTILSAGSGYTNGSHTNIATASGTGSSLTVDVTVSGNAITAASINTAGTGYAIGDTVTVNGAGGTNATLLVGVPLVLDDANLFPITTPNANYHYRVAFVNGSGAVKRAFYNNRVGNVLNPTNLDNGFTPLSGDEIYVEDLHVIPGNTTYPQVLETFLNRAWAHPYCPGGLRQGDTVWMNMHYTNPHAIEGLFCKSRGTLNEAEVWTGFNGGQGTLNNNPRDSIPLENFLIGNTCIETAKNLVQHINKTIGLNYEALENDAVVPVVAYLDPYQCTDDFVRILLYDVGHDREFIAFQDLHMQVQSSPAAAKIGSKVSTTAAGTIVNSVTGLGSQLDVAAGFPSQNKLLLATEKSDFIEASYAHASDINKSVTGGLSEHNVGGLGSIAKDSYSARTNPAVASASDSITDHQIIDSTSRESSTFFDTPDGTRVIPAFLAMKGIRNTTLDLTSHDETRLQYLNHWNQMDFVRRLSVDLGEVALKDGVTNIESAAREVVRLINQAGAKNGKTHARRPNDQFLGDGAKFDLTSPGPKSNAYGSNIDPAATHLHADFAATASTHDPAPFWDTSKAFSSHDRGTHMGYVRAHLGRVVLDSEDNPGFSIVIHSTIPGAAGRNFCTWLDSSKAQSPYRPQFLIGHGGRFRNYWCQPDEVTGENMHPAPMPINRFGRPFAPITTLKEHLPPENPSDPFINNLNLGADGIVGPGILADANIELVSGRNSNTLLNESFETKSPSSTLVDGLRVGTRAKARINFGGLTQAGIPGWAPDVSRWGYDNDGSQANFRTKYGSATNAARPMTETTVGTTGGYIPQDDMKKQNIGKSPLYGIRMVDHRGDNHTIRFVYRQFGESFANDNTYLPPTLDEEVVIHFDDRDVGQGGFTVGKHMVGTGEVCGELTGGTLQFFKGNLWNNYPSPHVGIHVTATLSGTTLEVVLTDPYHNGGSFSHPDILGYLGFPESGMLQLSDDAGTSGNQGMTTFYTSRSHFAKAGGTSNKHFFYGVTNATAIVTGGPGLILSPRINFTCLLTDEVMAAAVEYAINSSNSEQEGVEASSFDCTHMFAPDGKTLGDWGVSPTAIRIKTMADNKTPLSKLFEVDITKDFGLLDGASTDAAVSNKHTGGLSTSEMDAGTRLDIGYIPSTILQITTKYRGANANTATPVLVDSQNNIVDTTIWQRNLRGENFIDVAGDRIIPRIDSPSALISAASGTTNIDVAGGQTWALFGKLACNNAVSWGEPFLIRYSSDKYATVRSEPGSACVTRVVYVGNASSSNWSTPSASDIIFKGYADTYDAIKTDGIRRAGSKQSSPFLYFRGGRDSPDHWVPLYFGGGFSGAVVDINDGTQNDYGEFYTHPYSSGPTGSAGMQNIGEVAGSYALLDTNAMLAMFPGTPYLDQHKGQNHPPFFNQDAILTFDMAKGANTKVTGVTYTDSATNGSPNTVSVNIPSPIVLRFAHPHARYSSSGNTNNQTTYMIFGPGQAFPHNQAAHEPQGADIVTAGNGYSAVPIHYNNDATKDTFLPNQLANGDATEHSGFNRGAGGALADKVALAHLPMTTFFQKNNETAFNYVMNWQPTKGFPSEDSSATKSYDQTNVKAFYYEGSAVASARPKHFHPFNHVPVGFGGGAANTIGGSNFVKTRRSAAVWHMDGGYHPGGHFLDNHVSKNPDHPTGTAARIANGSGAARNPTVFRPCGLLAKAYLGYYGGAPTNQGVSNNIVIVDATRVQNAEELATIISASINTFPGTDPLKAMGGTFMPSMQNAHKQDRYGWVKATVQSYNQETDGDGGAAGTVVINGSFDKLPEYGWVRMSDGTNAYYAPYVSTSYSAPNLTLTLGINPGGSNKTNFVNPHNNTDLTSLAGGTTYEAYVWTKAGTHRYNNDSGNSARDHMTQVHFSGYVDAVDRTKAVGAVGWHGERYSYFNSLDITGNTYAAGLGAWHPFLGFNPYGAAETCLAGSSPAPVTGEGSLSAAFVSDFCVSGLSSRHLIVISHESELPLVAKADRDSITCTGDMLTMVGVGDSIHAGTIAWNTGKVHNKDRYVGPATAGPHVEVQIHKSQFRPSTADDYPAGNALPADAKWHRTIQSGDMVRANACRYPTGDLFWDESTVSQNSFHESQSTYATECIGITGATHYLSSSANQGNNGLFGYYSKRSAARNFLPEHVVWKRMDGGSLTMPAVNARGLGMIPWVNRKDSSATDYKMVGEKILGNVRFSFETTNAAMFPIIQAQELGHPQLAEQHPLEIRNALLIPNEHKQFESMVVVDDTGQEHRIEGGSPFGTVIMDFRHISDREIEGLAPALAGAGVNPNLKIRLPNPDEIPGNIVIRSGFDRIQGYQNETVGSGGLQHPAQNITQIRQMFSHEYAGPRVWPTWENNGWEHLSQDGTDISFTKSNTRLGFPASKKEGWEDHTDNNPLKSSFEPHDRSLYFHVTRMGTTMTHRYDLQELNFVDADISGGTISVNENPETSIWLDGTQLSGGRYFLRVYNPETGEGVIASYTHLASKKGFGTSSNKVVFSPDFEQFIIDNNDLNNSTLKVVPSYYVPAGTTRMFASRRLRDHSEYSGASPDMKKIDWFKMYSNLPANTGAFAANSIPSQYINAPRMTPMPIPRMGHHYITPTMALMPGHYAHPAYQSLYDLHQACKSSSHEPLSTSLTGIIKADRTSTANTVDTQGFSKDPLVWFSTPSAAYSPSDIHGGAFTLLTETKLKYEGYGVAASVGNNAGAVNAQGGHTLVLEAAATYTLNNHFPDPLEVGAYQIIIQPNVFKQQLKGFHQNHSDAVKAPSEAGSKVTELTGQQVNTVIAIEKDVNTRGAYALILSEAMMADVRGCEVILNEIILDIDPDPGSQFTNLPPLALYNPLGVQESSSPNFTRRSLPYRPGMFASSTPGRTLNIPWWSILHKDGAAAAAAAKFRYLEWHKPDNYYEFCRASYGSVGAQLTLAGYPTSFLDIYEPHKRNRSLNPHCVVITTAQGSGEIRVDNADLFPIVPYYGEVLEYTKNGVRYTAPYTNVHGTLATGDPSLTTKFNGVANTSATAGFWSNLAIGDILTLSKPYNYGSAESIYLDSDTSIVTRNLPQLANGSRDTNSLHPADAFLSMWHPNLGRPFTWYSDDASRSIYTKAGAADTPVDQKPYNHVPEHFETIHYHDFNYVSSKGPFALGMKWIAPPHDSAATGQVYTAAQIDALSDGDGTLNHQGGTSGGNKYNFFGMWPGGSHGGGATSRLESYGHSLIGWGSDTFGMDCETYQDSTGVTTLSLPNDRNRCFGYRMGVRQLYNRPRWSPYERGWLEVANTRAMLGYYNGPLIQQDSKTGGWDYVGFDTAQADVNFDALYVGILERITQVSSLLGQDQIGRQVRYSDGRRMTSSFGCPVRTVRNASTVTRMFPNDEEGQGIEELARAHRHYMVDWWGNTRGEDVRRFPVRGFGMRPSWDPEDAYKDTNVAHRPAANDLFGGDGGDRQSGNANTVNNDATNMGVVDWFNPASMLRVGDRGDGRGCRWPTVFNESLLMAISETHDASGIVLSANTAEPAYGQGLVRPSNNTLQAGEIERGISDRVDLDSDDGLLKPSAHVGEATETVNADIRGAEPVSRDDVRLGLDVDTVAELNDGVSREYVVMSTEAHSLHTDREVGQRTNIRGAYNFGSRTLKDLDMTALNWSSAPVTGVVKHSDAHAMWPLGGTYVMDWNKYSGNLDVKGWGQQIPQSGLSLWLRADSISVDDGATVSEWKDQSGNGRDFTQSTANDKPTFVTSDATFNNKPCVQFSSDDLLIKSFDTGLNTNEFTTFTVMCTNNDNNNYQVGYESRGFPSSIRMGYNIYANMSGSFNRWEFWAGQSSSWSAINSPNGTAVVNQPNILTVSIEGGNGAGGTVTAQGLRVDGTLATGLALSSSTLTPNYYKNTNEASQVGKVTDTGSTGTFPLIGKIAEVIHYDRKLTAAEINLVEGYLSSRYNITVTQNTWSPSNPYQDDGHNPISQNINFTDNNIQFLYRPAFGLDFKHSQMFRSYVALKGSSPQENSNFYRATAGGKYGMFTSDAPGARTGTPSSPPYAPVYTVDPDTSTTVPVSQGPKIPGVDVTGYDKSDITNPVARMVMSENTLEHFRADASRRSIDDDEGDYSVQPRHSQTLHPKGSKGDASYNTGDHSGE